MSIRKVNAIIRYYGGVDPDTLDDDKWAEVFHEIKWVREQEAKIIGKK